MLIAATSWAETPYRTLWTHQIGTSGDDAANGAAADTGGNVYVAGYTVGGLDGNTNAGGQDIVVIKYNANGNTAWTRQIGTSGDDVAYGVAVDGNGNAYLTGYTSGGLDGNPFAGGPRDIFVIKYDTTGNKVWTRQLGTSGDDVGLGVAVDAGGNVYAAGYTKGDLDGNPNAGGEGDIFLVKYDTNGMKVWTKLLGSSAGDAAYSVAVDGSGNVYATGYTYGGLDGNTNAGGGTDIFVIKYDTSGNKVWTRQMGTSTYDYGFGIAVDGNGNAYIAGQTMNGLDGNAFAGGADIVVIKYDTNGNKVWTKQTGGETYDYGWSIALDNNNNVYVTGETSGGLDGNANAGGYDLLVIKYDSSGSTLWTRQMGTSADDYGNGIAADSTGGVYIAGWTGGGLNGNTGAGGLDLFVMKLDSTVIQLPRTGQTMCYDAAGSAISCAGTGQDGEIQAGAAWPNPRFLDNGNGTITDNLTGLMWQQDGSTSTAGACIGGQKTWQEALDYVACLNLNLYLGYSDWRLPNINELASLVSRSESVPALPAGHPFSGVHSYSYWSSTTALAYNPLHAWDVDMSSGDVSSLYKGYSSSYVISVRGGQCESSGTAVICLPKTGQVITYAAGDDGDMQTGVAWPNPRFTNPDGSTPTINNIILDKLTGLEWAKDAGTPTYAGNSSTCTGGPMTWQAALDYVACLNTNNYLGNRDWRLPNVVELSSLIDHSALDPALPSGHPFSNMQSYFWSSTTSAQYKGYAWYFPIYYGYADDNVKSSLNYVWPVRSGQGAPAVPFTAFLHGSGSNANPSVLFLDSAAPAVSTAKYRDAGSIKFSGGNLWKPIGTWDAGPAFTSGTLSALTDLQVWLGLKNSDDIGTRFDLAAEVWKNDTIVARGEMLCITGVTRNPDLAKEVSVPFQPFSPISFNGNSDVMHLKVFTRIGTDGSGGFCGGHSNAVGLRLYFDAVDRSAQFGGSFD